jgi:hypothetical protein
MSQLVTVFNNNPLKNQYGTYFDAGNGVLGLGTTFTIKNNLCPGGVLSLNVFPN